MTEEQKPELTTTTSIVQIPKPEVILASLQQQAQQLLEYARARVVQSANDVKSATEDLSLIAKAKKTLEDKRKEYVLPLNNEVKLINDTFKLVSEPLNEADKITRDKVLAFSSEQERLRREAEEINRQKEELARREAALKREVTIDTTPVEVPPEPAKHVYTDIGTASKMMVKKWEVENFALVPDEYKVIDAAKVGKLVKAGIGSIPGIRIWQEESLRITTK